MTPRPRVLVVSPDFPPAHGGIQHVVHRVVRHAPRYDPRVVTLDAPGAAEFDATQPFAVRRVRALPAIRSRVPEAEWVVIGDGSLRAELAAASTSVGP